MLSPVTRDIKLEACPIFERRVTQDETGTQLEVHSYYSTTSQQCFCLLDVIDN